ncbi:hypothetical protein AFK68_03130 [Hydrocoleum sp. CS-953]|uniref:DUF1822 family protein n=1 Tax=Hydrocoleum sp. CS-953 TaxID=1671698 RepID=UPI000B9B3A17|nr:DUF1822 family protein [Hydrocoleum sp. CS-953]OZH55668.1 hypothetical protein AFK68_03130 [Hydrocoleum sp. CS-953]
MSVTQKMSLTIDELTIVYPDQLILEFSPEEIEQVWQELPKYSNDAARWNAFLNHLCLNIMMKYLAEDEPPETQPQISPNLETLNQIWEVVNGSAITIGETRIILIPTEEIDTETFAIPQEWVDLPTWVGDYYLAALVEPEEERMRIWGYTSYQNLKDEANYDEFDRLYYLGQEFMTEDLNVMWVAREVCPLPKPEVVAVGSLSGDEATTLVRELGRSPGYYPRLEVEFEKWGALLENQNLLRMLYEERLGDERKTSTSTNLLQWLDGIFETAWQTVDEILTPEQLFSYRSRSYRSRENIFSPSVRISRGKKIDLGMRLVEESVALVVSCLPETEEDNIKIQVYPMGEKTYLPPGVKLIVMDENGEEFEPAISRDADNFIQLQFSAETGDKFSVAVALEEARITEEFCLE